MEYWNVSGIKPILNSTLNLRGLQKMSHFPQKYPAEHLHMSLLMTDAKNWTLALTEKSTLCHSKYNPSLYVVY